MSDKISIIVPIYNVKKYIQQCVESLINQTYKNLEIILIDDGSTDGCGELCDEFGKKDQRIHVIHKQNGGLSDARNKGIDVASGDYIGFVDSDDWISHNMYEKMLSSLKSVNADIAVCGWVEEFLNNSIEKCPPQKILDKNEALKELLENLLIADHACDKLYKTSLFKNIRYPVGKTYEDILTTYKLFNNANKVLYISDAFYHYRQRKGSIARSNFNLKKMEWLDAVKSLESDPIIELNDTFSSIIHDRIFHTKCFLLREMLLNTDDKYLKECMPFIDEFYNELKSKKFHVIKSTKYSKSLKVMALLTFGGKNLLIKLFHSNWYKQYTGDKYKYYE